MRLFHISENPNLEFFEPRPCPSDAYDIKGNVVFAISEILLHNYLFPRDCPRVTYYVGPNTSASDRNMFFENSTAEFIVATESKWLPIMRRTTIYQYEFSDASFHLLDSCAGYYISSERQYPLSVKEIVNPVDELLARNLELRFMLSLEKLAKSVSASTLQFSLIRMRNAGNQLTF